MDEYDSDLDIKAAVAFPNQGHNVVALNGRSLPESQHSITEDNVHELQPVKESDITSRPISRQRLPAVLAAERFNEPQQNLRPFSTFVNSDNTAPQQQVKVFADDKDPETTARSQALARMRSAPKSISKLKKLLSQQRPWYAQQPVHFITLLVMMMLCVLR